MTHCIMNMEQMETRRYFYTSIKECLNTKRVQTNPRYSNFKQYYYTAGDEEQYFRYIDNTDVIFENDIDLTGNLYKDMSFEPKWEKYKDVEPDTMMNTFRYIFYKFKKGIFIKIINNQLKVFLPFSNASYENEWSDKIKVDTTKYSSVQDFLRFITETSGYRFNPKNISNNIKTWYGNNCIVRYEYPISEGDTNVTTIKNMLTELCEKRKVPNVEFFINRRDFPVITKDLTEPYDNIWGSKNIPLVSHNFDKYLPIMSMSVTHRYSDILFPVYEDWERIQSNESIYFPPKCKDYPILFDIPWSDKKPTAVFRGGSTGCGVTVETNPRLKVSSLSKMGVKDDDGVPFLDAGITNWNLRPRKIIDSEFLQTIDHKNLGFDLVSKLTPYEQSKYKYIINIDGHVSAFRLSLELNMGSVILKVDSEWTVWYSRFLKPYIHYVPVKSDLSDLYEQIKWCKQNDDKCIEIVSNAKSFYKKYLQKTGVLDYLQKLLIDTKIVSGNYKYPEKSILDCFIDYEYRNLIMKYPSIDNNIIHTIPDIRRSYGLLHGIEWSIRKTLKEQNIINTLKDPEDIFTNKLGSVKKYTYASFPIIMKTTTDFYKKKEHIHEVFIATRVINKLICHIPNFMYVFGLYENDNEISVISEYIVGKTLFEYINSIEFNFREFLLILLQLSLALEVAQNKCGFVHYDLTPWNIILKRLPRLETLEYSIGPNKIISVNTHIIPVIIDYGKSHVIYNNTHHGFINMFQTSTVQDILSLLLNSVSQIITKKRISPKDFSSLVFLSNFISGTTYRKSSFNNAESIITFFFQSRKYTNLIYHPKYELERFSPIDLFNYIMNLDNKYRFPIHIMSEYSNQTDDYNTRQVFDYIYANTDRDKIETFFDVFTRVNQSTVPQPDNMILSYYSIQSLYNSLSNVKDNLISYTSNKNIDIKLDVINNTIECIEKLYKQHLQVRETSEFDYTFDVSNYQTLEVTPYNNITVLSKKKVSQLIENYQNIRYKDYHTYIDILHTIFNHNGKYKLDKRLRSFYTTKFKTLLDVKPVIMLTNMANKHTLYFIQSKCLK